MPKIKIVATLTIYSSDYDDYYSQEILRQGITDWEEVSNEDLKFLKDNLWRITSSFPGGATPIIVVLDETSVINQISSIKSYIEEEQRKIRIEAEKAEKARIERAAKKKLAKEAKTRAEELALLESLKEKYPNE